MSNSSTGFLSSHFLARITSNSKPRLMRLPHTFQHA
jgi:hypothetical protein